MNWVHPAVLILAAWLLAFAQASILLPRHLLGAQPDFIPGLVVYAALATRLPITVAVAVVGGLGLDALSSGPFGLGVVPLLALGVALHARRDLVLRDSIWAQALLGGGGALGVALVSVTLLIVLGPVLPGDPGDAPFWPELRGAGMAPPVVGARFFGVILVVTAVAALTTPLLFRGFGWVRTAFDYRPSVEGGPRPDREIKRGRF